MRTADFDYDLPPDRIAQTPAPERDQSRLLVLHRQSGRIEHRLFPDLLEYLRPGDLLVLNNSRVLAARLRGRNAGSTGRFEMLLLEENAVNDWWVMLRPGKRARQGTRIILHNTADEPTPIQATVLGKNDEGHRRLQFHGAPDILDLIDSLGEVPLPPYIERRDRTRLEEDRRRYQTVFAGPRGSVAAPTAGLHFTQPLLRRVRERGVGTIFVTLHVGLATFAPVKVSNPAMHPMHEERYELTADAAGAVNAARAAGGRIFAAGTTVVRVLETAAAIHGGRLSAQSGRTRLFLHPPCEFRVVDALVTNYHLPRSTLLMLVSAFAAPGQTRGRELVLSAYAEAIARGYRFYSYGDAMLLI